MALRIASDADAADAAPAQHAVVDNVERAPERPALGAVAGDHQHRFDAGFAVEPRQEIVERFDACEVARRHMRHRLEAGGAYLHRGSEQLVGRPVRHRAQINARAAPEGREPSDVGRRRPGRFDGEAVHERGDACDRIERRLILSCERGHLSVLALLTRSE